MRDYRKGNEKSLETVNDQFVGCHLIELDFSSIYVACCSVHVIKVLVVSTEHERVCLFHMSEKSLKYQCHVLQVVTFVGLLPK